MKPAEKKLHKAVTANLTDLDFERLKRVTSTISQRAGFEIRQAEVLRFAILAYITKIEQGNV